MPEKQEDKKRELTRQESELFSLIIKNLSMALKNSVLYAYDHPIYKASLDNFRSSLEMWFASSERFDLGVAQEALYIGSVPAAPGNERAVEVANYLHVRGIISISFIKGLNSGELGSLFNFLKEDKKIIRDKGGVLANVPPSPHIQIREIDYSVLLAKQKETGDKSDEEKIWQFLFDISSDIKIGEDLPESKVEFLVDFFKDTQRSATVINKVYKEAINRMDDEETAKNIRGTVAKVCDYFEKHSWNKGKEVKVELMKIVSQLHPDLINVLFEKTVVDDKNFDLAEEVTKDLSDSFIASFIESLITQESNFNENLLKVFDKLTPGESKANSVVNMVADRLLGRRVLNADALTKLQMSIKEIFKTHPHSGFMSQMYNITVDAVVNKKIDTLVYVARLSPLLNKFAQSMAEDKLQKEEIWLLLNILWLESNPLEFNKFSSKLAGTLTELLDAKDTVRIREILQFFTEKMRPEQTADTQMSTEIKDVISRITSKEAIDSIISFVAEADSKSLDDIGDILSRAGERAAGPLVDAFLAEKNPAQRNKYRQLFSKSSAAVVEEVVTRLEYIDVNVASDLLGILKEQDQDKANLIAKRLFWNKDARARWEGLEVFEAKNEDDRSSLFLMFKKEKDKEVRKKAAMVLLETRVPDAIGLLFRYTDGGFFGRAFLPHLVEACGRIKCQEAFPHLAKLLLRKYFFITPWRDNLRVAAVTALGRLRTPEAMELVKGGVKDKSAKVRKLCEILVKLDQSGRGRQPGQKPEGNAHDDK
jgi:hypothetical protein